MRSLAVLALTFLAAAPVHAARFGQFRIERDGVVILEGTFTLPDGNDATDDWQELDRARWKPVGPAIGELAQATETELKGDLHIILAWGGWPPVFDVKTDRLRLVPAPLAADGWAIPEGELKRVGRAAGLDVDRMPRWMFGNLITLAGVIVFAAFTVFVVWRWRRTVQFTAGADPA